MCMAILIPKGKEAPSQECLSHCWDSNPHGGGFMYATNGKIRIFKYKKKEDFLNGFNRHFPQFGAVSPFVLHMRFATHGDKTETNTHPIRVNRNLAFVHNGIISKTTSVSKDPKDCKDYSDTVRFSTLILRKMPTAWISLDVVQMLLEHYVGTSRLIFLTSEGNTFILNEDGGTWDKDVWYSNSGYTPFKSKWGWYGWNDEDVELPPRNYKPQYPIYIDNIFKGPEDAAKVYGMVCKVCEKTVTTSTSMDLMIQIEDHTHFCLVCQDCMSMILTNNDPMIIQDPSEFAAMTCSYCDQKKNGMMSYTYICFKKDDDIASGWTARSACASCAHKYFKTRETKTQISGCTVYTTEFCTHSSGDIDAIMNKTTGIINAEKFKSIVESVRKERGIRKES